MIRYTRFIRIQLKFPMHSHSVLIHIQFHNFPHNCVCNLVICNFIDLFVKLFHKFNNKEKPYWLFAMSFAGDKLFGLFHTCFMWHIPFKAPRDERVRRDNRCVFIRCVFMSVCSECCCCCCCCFMLDGYSQIDASDTSQIHRNCHSKMWWQCGMKRAERER